MGRTRPLPCILLALTCLGCETLPPPTDDELREACLFPEPVDCDPGAQPGLVFQSRTCWEMSQAITPEMERCLAHVRCEQDHQEARRAHDAACYELDRRLEEKKASAGTTPP